MKTIPKLCFICNSNLPKDIIGLNKKLMGRKIGKYLCLLCLADYLEVTSDELLNKIEEFKEQGCSLFS